PRQAPFGVFGRQILYLDLRGRHDGCMLVRRDATRDRSGCTPIRHLDHAFSDSHLDPLVEGAHREDRTEGAYGDSPGMHDERSCWVFYDLKESLALRELDLPMEVIEVDGRFGGGIQDHLRAVGERDISYFAHPAHVDIAALEPKST